MQRVWTEEDVVLDILTEREGVLSRAGHDLRLRAERLRAERDGGVLRLTVPASAIEPICARVGDRDAFGALSSADLRRIKSNLHGEILQIRRFPLVEVQVQVPADPLATWTTASVQLCGVRGDLRLYLERRHGQVHGHAELLQTSFGVQPYTTMFGAIRVSDRLTVQCSGPVALFAPLA